MSFISPEFFVLLTVALVTFFSVPRKYQVVLLLIASYWFYAAQGVAYCALLFGVSLLSWGAGLLIERWRNARVVALCIGLVPILASLCLFKYYNFFATQCANAFGWALPTLTWLAPLGISFYTFQSLGYLIDIYQNVRTSERNFLRYAAFVSFFPCITAGPIARSEQSLAQFAQPIAFSYEQFAQGMTRILLGVFRKYVIAETIGVAVNAIYGAAGTGSPQAQGAGGPFLLLAALLYSYQIYSDFAGYSDIAIGLAQLFGIHVMENFRRPFSAKTYSALWDRWHISLTSWFRDYVFTPLSMKTIGSNHVRALGYCFLVLIFLLSGLWHGAAWTYIVWGLLNGIYMLIEKTTAKKRRKLAKKNPLYRKIWVKNVIQTVIVYLMFTSCIVFFRVNTLQDGVYVYRSMLGGWGSIVRTPSIITQTFAVMGFTLPTLAWLTCAVVGIEWLDYKAEHATCTTAQWVRTLSAKYRIVLYYVLLLAIACVGVFGNNSFIYNQF